MEQQLVVTENWINQIEKTLIKIQKDILVLNHKKKEQNSSSYTIPICFIIFQLLFIIIVILFLFHLKKQVNYLEETLIRKD